MGGFFGQNNKKTRGYTIGIQMFFVQFDRESKKSVSVGQQKGRYLSDSGPLRNRIKKKKRGRKEDLRSERKRLTASATFLDYKIPNGFERNMTGMKTNQVFFVNKHGIRTRQKDKHPFLTGIFAYGIVTLRNTADFPYRFL